MKYLASIILFVWLSFPAFAQGEEPIEFAQELPKPTIDLAQFLGKNMTYPKEAVKKNIQGTVYVRTVIDESGSVVDSTIQISKGIKGEDGGLHEEAIRLVKLIPDGAFSPGKNNGKPIRVWISIPIRFALID